MERKIEFTPDCFHRSIKITIDVPSKFDAEEYIDAYFDSILNENTKYNVEWDFID